MFASRAFTAILSVLAPVAFVFLVGHVILNSNRKEAPKRPEHVCMMKNPEYCIYNHVS